MKYAVLKCVNGNFSVEAEGFTELSSAKVSYHGLCQALWNAPDVITAEAIVVDERFDVVTGCREFISHSEPATEE